MPAMLSKWRVRRTTALVWRTRPPVPRDIWGWYLPVVAAGMDQKQSGAARSTAAASWRMEASGINSNSLFNCVFMVLIIFGLEEVAGVEIGVDGVGDAVSTGGGWAVAKSARAGGIRREVCDRVTETALCAGGWRIDGVVSR